MMKNLSYLDDDGEKGFEEIKAEFEERVIKVVPGVSGLPEEEQRKILNLWYLMHKQAQLLNKQEETLQSFISLHQKNKEGYDQLLVSHRSILDLNEKLLSEGLYKTFTGKQDDHHDEGSTEQ